MLRYVFRLHRQSIESEPEEWVEYMRGSAHVVDAMALKFGLNDWVISYRKRKYTFAGKVARQPDDRWSKLMVQWTPNGGIGRSRGRPCTRWSDDLEKYAGGAWTQSALDESLWASAEHGFTMTPP